MRVDWIECKSSDLLDVRDGTHDTPKYIKDGGFPLITSKNLIKGNIDFSNTKFISEIDMNLINQRSKVDIGDILFAMIGTIGNPVVVKEEPKFSIKNIGLFKNKTKVVDSLLFKYFLDSPLFLNQLDKRQLLKGTTQKFIPLGSLRDINFPLAPLPEQRAIVKKLESLFSSLDAGVTDLKKAQQQLKIYRQAVLKKAFEGELTKGWREKNSYNMDDFLKELKNKKVTAIKEKLISKGDYFPNYKLEQLNFTTPNSWLSLPWKTLTSNRKYALKRGPFGSALKKDFFVESGTVVYEQGHAINDDPYRHRYFITPEKFEELKAFAVGAGDLIISCSGATLGRICLLPEDAEVGVINQALLKVDLDEELILKKYFLILFRSESFQRLIFSKALGSAMPNMVGMEELKEMPIPIPSILEQKEIVKQIESRLSVCDSIEQNIKESLIKAEALRQSILKKAFEGNLLTAQELAACKQAADYEPASVLLQRIRNEKLKIRKK